MPPPRILDTHIHLWPSTSTSPQSHAWMSPGHFLAKRHGTADYLASAQPPPTGFVYVETDRYVPRSLPSGAPSTAALLDWAREPLEEIKFLRRIVEGTTGEGDGVQEGQGRLMKGCVLWAPFHAREELFGMYLRVAEDVAGPELWGKVVGFRYLLQGKERGEVENLVATDAWVENIVSLGRRFAFDVGVDVHRDGEEGLEAVGKMIERVRGREGGEEVRFVLNHLCKPNLSLAPSQRWISALTRLGKVENVYMKLSGAFNEFDTTPSSIQDIVAALDPFLTTVFMSFPNRIMFGSDWPVCNVGGPKGEPGNWKFWVEVVEAILEERDLSAEEKENVWWRTGARAYAIDSV